jgi:phage terminase small subunit
MSQSRPTKAEIDKYAGHYVLHGEQSNAWREAFPKSKAKTEVIHINASKFHKLPKVQLRVKEFSQRVRAIAEDEFNIDASWVLKQAKKVHERCMQSEPVTDRKGAPVLIENNDGDLVPAYTFEAAGANKSLEIIGKHIDVQAFNENLNVTNNETTPWGSIKASVDKLDE